MKKIFIVIGSFCIGTIIHAQNTQITCACNTNNILATGKIVFQKEKKYSATLTTFNYKTDIIFTNNTNCKMEIKSATIGDKTTFLQSVITTIGDKKRSWIKNISHTKPLEVINGKAKVLFNYKLNKINCMQEILISVL